MNDGRSISVASISQDSFYRDLNPEQMILAKKSEYNFDHPDTIDDDEIFRKLDFQFNPKGFQPTKDSRIVPLSPW